MYGTEPRIQLNDQFAEVSDIKEFVEKERAARNEVDRPLLSTTIKSDGSVKMGILTDIKQELREIGAFKITYATRRGKKK